MKWVQDFRKDKGQQIDQRGNWRFSEIMVTNSVADRDSLHPNPDQYPGFLMPECF
jgi:hypothetical protein